MFVGDPPVSGVTTVLLVFAMVGKSKARLVFDEIMMYDVCCIAKIGAKVPTPRERYVQYTTVGKKSCGQQGAVDNKELWTTKSCGQHTVGLNPVDNKKLWTTKSLPTETPCSALQDGQPDSSL